MPRDSNGNTSPLPGTLVSLGQTLLPSQHNPMVEDLYDMMTDSLSRDGQGGMLSALDMGGFQVRNMAAGTFPNDAVRKTEFDAQTTAITTGLALKLDILQAAIDLASASTTDLGSVASQNVRVTGTTTITSFGTAAAGTFRRILFPGVLTLTYNATTMLLPSNANIITAIGDIAEFVSEGSGNWRCVNYFRRQSLPYVTTNIVGTVSQASGIPTAAIIETGSNANGTYTRYADGTQICTKSFNAGTVAFSASGSVFISAAINPGSFAASFSAAPVVSSPSVLSSTGLVWAAMATAASTTAWPQFYAFSSVVTSSTGTTLSLIAVGRWF